MPRNRNHKSKPNIEVVHFPLNKLSHDALKMIQKKTGFDIPGAVSFALVVAGGVLKVANPADLHSLLTEYEKDDWNEIANKQQTGAS